MKRVLIESPYKGDVRKHLAYVRACCYHCVVQNEAPFASHLLLTQFLDDTDKDERSLGIQLGFEWGNQANLVAFYIDLGISSGMAMAKAFWGQKCMPVEDRRLSPKIIRMFSEGKFNEPLWMPTNEMSLTPKATIVPVS